MLNIMNAENAESAKKVKTPSDSILFLQKVT
jgi:hypothetical protein